MTDQTKPVCYARRHLTPSQFMVYDAMFHMAKRPVLDDRAAVRVCYATILTIANKTSLGRDRIIDNIKELVALRWLIPDDPGMRWKNGRWANNRYLVLDHEQYRQRAAVPCPALKYDTETGQNLMPYTRRVGIIRHRPCRKSPTPSVSESSRITVSEEADTST
jgi:hypothetical protein